MNNESIWSERVKAWQSSGETISGFAEREGLKASTLRYWSRELLRRARLREKVPVSPTMAKVIRPEVARGGVIVKVGPAEVTVFRGFDAELLREVLRALVEEQ